MGPPYDAFPPTAAAARARLAAVRPDDYARSRNALDGAVTRLSPYLTHGLLTLPEVLRAVVSRQPLPLNHRFVLELGWRAFFHHVWAARGEGIERSLHAGPLPDDAYGRALPDDLRHARTGVPAIDQAVRTLYADGWLHNHARLWLASYVVHLRKVHWRVGAEWMFGHLLDGDLASNHLSWQWVAGTGSHKPYLFNADNVARFAPAAWHSPGSAIDRPYEVMDALARDPETVATPPPGAHAQGADVPGTDEPPLAARPPPGLTARPPAPGALAGRHVWLMHPWALRAPPPGLHVVGVLPAEPLRRHPWSLRRWGFVTGAMSPWLSAVAGPWYGSDDDVAAALAGAASVATVAEPHWTGLGGLARTMPPPRLFPEVDPVCRSFSQWWRRATAGIGDVPSLLAAASVRDASVGVNDL